MTWVLFQFMCTAPATRGSLHECSRNYVALAWLVPPWKYMHPGFHLHPSCFYCEYMHMHLVLLTPENTYTLWHPDGLRLSGCMYGVRSQTLSGFGRVHRHIGYISLAFLHGAFSNVSSNLMNKRMHVLGCWVACTLYASSSSLAMAAHTVILVTSISPFSRE